MNICIFQVSIIIICEKLLAGNFELWWRLRGKHICLSPLWNWRAAEGGQRKRTQHCAAPPPAPYQPTRFWDGRCKAGWNASADGVQEECVLFGTGQRNTAMRRPQQWCSVQCSANELSVHCWPDTSPSVANTMLNSVRWQCTTGEHALF